MSFISEDSFTEEEDSFKEYQNKTGKINNESIIDESAGNSESSVEPSIDVDETNISCSEQPSQVFTVKKRAPRPLDSDTDSDNDTSRSAFVASESSTNEKEINTSSDSPNRSRSFLTVQKKKTLSFASDSDEETPPTQLLKEKSSSRSIGKTSRQNSRQKKAMVIDSDSDDDSTETIDRFESSSNKSKNAMTESRSDKRNTSEDVLNLSQKMSQSRISSQFQFNRKGILNSTAIHSELNSEGNGKKPLQNIIHETREEINKSVEVLSDNDSDIIEVSSDEQGTTPKKTIILPKPLTVARQQTLFPFLTKKEAPTPSNKPTTINPLNVPSPHLQKPPESSKIEVTPSEYESQRNKVRNLEADMSKLSNMMRTVKLDALPDKGKLLRDRERAVGNKLQEERDRLGKMVVTKEDTEEVKKSGLANVNWEDIQAGANAVLPKTFGKHAMSTYNAQKAITLDRLQQLHGSLQTCPKEDDFAEDPKGLKVPLMEHQKRALAWLVFRERQKPAGGILADDMGLGKTLTMIALIVKTFEIEQNSKDEDQENDYQGKNTKYKGGSLIVCPASLLQQWSGEIERRLKRGLISYQIYHGPKRETKPKRLAEHDVVITTYSIINNEAEKESAAFRIKWRRIILDEAHQIRNHKSQTSEACCKLTAKSRWALTGTPMHNKELDMYALLKFLRCSPFDDIQVWKRWVGDKSTGGQERLHTVISSLMLRRTKVELMEKGSLTCMPEKKWELVTIELDKNEMGVYHKVLIFSQTLFAQFLHQRAEKDQDAIDQRFTDVPNNAPNQEYFKMRQKLLKLNKVKNVSQHEILVLLLRLRQICCHPSLITAMLDESKEDVGADDEECEELNLLDQLSKMNIDDEDAYNPTASFNGISQDEKVTLKEASKGLLNPSHPVFSKDRASSKIKAMLKVLKDQVLTQSDKAIVVSQWPSYLNLVAIHLKECNIEFDQLDGKVPVIKRMEMVDRFNNPHDKMRVLLLSLTAGGVGLNLVGANHLFLLDLHWNPQLENQAQDRIYRVGQTKPVFVYKFMASGTIEERIKSLQDRKLAMAEGILTGTKQVVQSKLSLQDLRMIFGM